MKLTEASDEMLRFMIPGPGSKWKRAEGLDCASVYAIDADPDRDGIVICFMYTDFSGHGEESWTGRDRLEVELFKQRYPIFMENVR